MSDILDAIKNWQAFFAAVTGATATLTGLLFVSLSFNLQRFQSGRDEKWLRSARGAFGDFLYVLLMSLMFLVPMRLAFGFTIGLVLLGAARGIGVISLLIRTLRVKEKRITCGRILREFALPVLAALGLIAIAIAIFAGATNAITGVVFVIAALLISACWKSWHLLLGEVES